MSFKRKHIVIIAQKFPPHSNVGGRRPYFFSKYLTELGYKVSVITGNHPIRENMIWETDLSFLKKIKLDSETLTAEEKGFKNFLYYFLKNSRHSILNRISWKIGEIFLPLDFNDRLDFNEYKLAKELGKIDYVIATGGPWSMFEYGVRLKSVSDAKLILDYRDPWNVVNKDVYLESLNNKGFGSVFIKKKQLSLERKYLELSSAVITVSSSISLNCKKILDRNNIHTIYNGFDQLEKVNNNTNIINKYFNVNYIGHLRKEQNVGLLIDSIKEVLIRHPELEKKIKINLIGGLISPSSVIKLITESSIKSIFNITSFVPKEEALSFLNSAQLLLQLSYKNKKGIVSSKIFQYMSSGKPILLVSNNEDIMEKIIRETNTGEICKTPDKIADYILNSYSKWENNITLEREVNKEKLAFYSFKNQVDLLDKIISDL
jgi:glycosyltransferase involved in cell wall biosynthesis